MTDLDKLIEKALAEDPEAREEYEKLGPRFELAGALVELRQARSLTQARLAELAATSQSAIAMIESGRRDPSFSTLQKIVRALGAEIDLVDINSKMKLPIAA